MSEDFYESNDEIQEEAVDETQPQNKKVVDKAPRETKNISITLSGDPAEDSTIQYQGKVDNETAVTIIKLCLETDRHSAISHTAVQADQQQSLRQKLSIMEYVKACAPKYKHEKILALAGFWLEIQQQESFRSGDIKVLFRDLREQPPKNFGRDFNKAIENGWVARDIGDRDKFFVTQSGLDLLKQGFESPLNTSRQRKKHTTNTRKRGKN